MTSKVIMIIKQYFFLMALVGLFVGFSAFKYTSYLDDPISGWYSIDVTDPDESEYDKPENQLITGHLPVGPSTACDPEVEETEPCAVYLDFSAYTGAGLTPTTTVQDVIAEDGLPSPTGAGNDDGYARKDE